MKRHVLISCLIVAVTVCMVIIVGCATVQTVAKDACAAGPDLVKTVTTDLGHDEYDAELSAILTTFCALENAVAAAAVVPAGAEVSIVVQHANAWRAAHGGAPQQKGNSMIKAGFPGGGHGCRWVQGTWFTTSAPFCPTPAVRITPDNLNTYCSCAPGQLWS